MGNRIIVVPTTNLANLVYKAIAAGKLPYNYVAGFIDVRGIGLSLGKVDWAVTPYINPHWRT